MKQLKIEKNKKILVLSPHADDETIGCGALIGKYPEQCSVALLTDGSKGNPEWSDSYTKRVRYQEFVSAMQFAGVENYYILNIEDSELIADRKKIDTIPFNKYDYIFCPNKYENHPDHIGAYYCLVGQILKRKIKNQRIFLYEVWTPLRSPTHYIIHTNEFKEEIIKKYKSQIKHVDYFGMAKGIGEYRNSYINKNRNSKGEFCETYEEMVPGNYLVFEYIKWKISLFGKSIKCSI